MIMKMKMINLSAIGCNLKIIIASSIISVHPENALNKTVVILYIQIQYNQQ